MRASEPAAMALPSAELWDDDDVGADDLSVRDIELKARRLVTDTMAGQYHAVFKGRGMSFDSVRAYQPGDDVRTIDWNVTARTGDVYIKQYVEERELTVLVAVDLSASMRIGTRDRSKRAMAAEIAAVLALSAVANNDRVGLVLFSDRIEGFVPPKKSRAHVLRIIHELRSARPSSPHSRIDVACDYVSLVQRRRAVVFLVSDFDCSVEWQRSLGVVARRHDVVPVAVRDPIERELADLGMLLRIEDAETGTAMLFDAGTRAGLAAYRQRALVAKVRTEQRFRAHGLADIAAEVGADYLKDLVAYFRRRAMRQ
ncbi:MAG: DUF58 domain-containing protein [Myxococcales bacterium]|nr:DUF58 domain-containing protein [Myxococcales bacterium]